MMVDPTNTGMNSSWAIALSRGIFELALRELFFSVEVLHHKFVIGLGHKVAELVARDDGGVCVFVGNIDDMLAFAFEIAGFHANDVDDALELGIDAHGDGNRTQTRAESAHEGSPSPKSKFARDRYG